MLYVYLSANTCLENYDPKIRSMVSAYVDSNKKLFSQKRFAVETKNRYPQFNKYYEDELKFKILIQEMDEWEKFKTLLDICMVSKLPFKYQAYRSKQIGREC